MDLFLTAQMYVDIASLSVVPRTTGGQVRVSNGGRMSLDG